MMTTNRTRTLFAPLAAVAVLSTVGSAHAAHGTFLPNVNPAPAPVETWGNLGMGMNPVSSTFTVRDGVKNIPAGELRFDFDTRTGGGNAGGGVGIAGGFFFNDGVSVKPGFELKWAQRVSSTFTGTAAQNLWNLPDQNAGFYPDVLPAPDGNGRNDPFYPFESLPVAVGADDTPDLAFQDFPQRPLALGEQTWFAQLGLLAVSTTANLEIDGQMFFEVRAIGTFIYGFNFEDTNENGTIDGISEVVADPAPSLFAGATGGFINHFNDFFDGAGGPDDLASGRYHFTANTNAFIPTPGVATLLALAGLTSIRRRRHAA